MTTPNSRSLPPTSDGFLAGSDTPEGQAVGLPPQGAGSRYQPLRLHARGGLGEVFLAHDAECDREVALKTVQTRHDNATGRARFLREAAITARLQHPAIVPVYGLETGAEGVAVLPGRRGRALRLGRAGDPGGGVAVPAIPVPPADSSSASEPPTW